HRSTSHQSSVWCARVGRGCEKQVLGCTFTPGCCSAGTHTAVVARSPPLQPSSGFTITAVPNSLPENSVLGREMYFGMGTIPRTPFLNSLVLHTYQRGPENGSTLLGRHRPHNTTTNPQPTYPQ
ncbi:unnamed protein product, partial [Scytosiphon promiscuus]